MAVLTVTGQTLTDTYTAAHAEDMEFTFTDNSIICAATDYLLEAGDEAIAAVNNYLDESIVTGNYLEWTGVPGAYITHGIFKGYNINDLIKYNYLLNVPYGVVLKSGEDGSNMTYTTGGVAYNIFKNSYIGVRIKGINSVPIYNNTFYNSSAANDSFIFITSNDDESMGSPSTGTKIKNNIFYSTVDFYNIYIEDGSDPGVTDIDYNIYYNEAGTPLFNYHGASTTFAEWQALGFDAHSYVLDPDFTDTDNFVPLARLDYGTDLTSTWETGLSDDAAWVVGTSPTTTTQDTTWQTGAIIIASEVIPDAPYDDMEITITGQGGSIYDDMLVTISGQAAPPVYTGTVGNIPLYRFYINAAGSTTYEVYPLNFLSTQIVMEQDKERAFYRYKFTGSLLFGTNSKVVDYDDGVTVHNRREDWELFWGYEQTDPSEILYLDIHKTVSGTVTTYWEGFFSTTDGSFDIDRCTFEVMPSVNDDYNIILDSADIQFNVMAVPAITTHAYLVGTFDQTYTRTRRFYDTVNDNVLTYIAQQIIPAVNVVSTFFSDASNYVTGITNELKYITIAQKSDILRYASSDPATSAMISWNELMNILWAMFQVKWTYDGIDTIYVEHISYFTKAAGLDIRTHEMTQETNKYNYLKEKMPKYEKFAFMEADNTNFVGLPIWYDSGMVDQDPETNVKLLSVPVTTDLEYIDFNPEAIADEGFVFLACDSTFHVLMGMSVYNYDIRLNMDLSWSNMHDKYFRHNRVLIQGYLNGTLTTFTTAQKTKIQQCSTIVCEDFDPDDEITTELGEVYFGGAKGTVQTASLHPTGELNLSLLYGPADNAAHTFDEPMFALIQEDASTCGKFYITLNTAAPLEMHIILSHEVLNALGVQDCTGGPETWTINLGETESTKTFTLCNSIGAGWCVNYAWTATDLTDEGYIVDIVTRCEC